MNFFKTNREKNIELKQIKIENNNSSDQHSTNIESSPPNSPRTQATFNNFSPCNDCLISRECKCFTIGLNLCVGILSIIGLTLAFTGESKQAREVGGKLFIGGICTIAIYSLSYIALTFFTYIGCRIIKRCCCK